jgi:hypothetical protein
MTDDDDVELERSILSGLVTCDGITVRAPTSSRTAARKRHMIGHSNSLASFNAILWADAELLGFAANYDAVVVTIKESTGLVRDIKCRGYIGYELIGFWDEVVIELGELLEEDSFLSACKQRIWGRFADDPPNSGCEARNGRAFGLLRITMTDGSILNVACALIETSAHDRSIADEGLG